MTKPTIREHNIETDKIVDREMTDAEFAFFSATKAENEAAVAAQEIKIAEKAALLEKLGITADEAALLLG